MNLDDFKVDLDKSEDGTWIPFGDEAQILIAQWGNEQHSAFLRKTYKQNKRQIDMGTLGEVASTVLMAGQWPHIVKGWKGITKNGEELIYSPKTVYDLAQNPQYKQFFKNIEEIAKDHATFRSEAVEELGES